MANETKSKAKNKNKNVNKTKIFLANPLKPKCQSLGDEDWKQLQEILTNSIKNSGEIPRSYATKANICLGLESSLRAINSGKAACVLLSTSIKPRYLLGLIARNVEVKDETVTTYTVAQLEDIAHKIFGVKTLSIVLPKDTTYLNEELVNWIEKQRKPKKGKIAASHIPVSARKKRKKVVSDEMPLCEQIEPSKFTKEKDENNAQMRPWGSKYISLSKENASMDIDEANPAEDENNLLNALDRMTQKAKQQTKSQMNILLSEHVERDNANAVEIETTKSDEDDFLGTYVPLTVHKIRPNPDRKPRKKRKKNANKSKNKK